MLYLYAIVVVFVIWYLFYYNRASDNAEEHQLTQYHRHHMPRHYASADGYESPYLEQQTSFPHGYYALNAYGSHLNNPYLSDALNKKESFVAGLRQELTGTQR